MSKVICPACSEQGLKSYVYEGFETSTLVHRPAYYDESGRRIVPPDPNTRKFYYRCSNGHNWYEQVGPEPHEK